MQQKDEFTHMPNVNVISDTDNTKQQIRNVCATLNNNSSWDSIAEQWTQIPWYSMLLFCYHTFKQHFESPPKSSRFPHFSISIENIGMNSYPVISQVFFDFFSSLTCI